MTTNIRGFADALRAAAAEAAETVELDLDPNIKDFEQILSESIRDALDRVNSGTTDSFEFGPWVLSNFIVFSAREGHDLSDTVVFLRELID